MRSAARMLLLLAASLGARCGQPLDDGTYAFAVRRILQDSCSAMPSDAAALPDARVETAGDTVQIAFAADGPLVPGLTGASGRHSLIGRFLPDGEADRFIADATFDVVREIGGVSCVVFSHASLEATVESRTSFSGTIRIAYTRRASSKVDCPAGCIVEFDVQAQRIGR